MKKYYCPEDVVTFNPTGSVICSIQFSYYPTLQLIFSRTSLLLNYKDYRSGYIFLKMTDRVCIENFELRFDHRFITSTISLKTRLVDISNLQKIYKIRTSQVFANNCLPPDIPVINTNFHLLKCVTLILGVLFSLAIIASRSNSRIALILCLSVITTATYNLITTFSSYLKTKKTNKQNWIQYDADLQSYQRLHETNINNHNRLQAGSQLDFHQIHNLINSDTKYQLHNDNSGLIAIGIEHTFIYSKKLKKKYSVINNINIDISDISYIYSTRSSWNKLCLHIIYYLTISDYSISILIFTNDKLKYISYVSSYLLRDLDNNIQIYYISQFIQIMGELGTQEYLIILDDDSVWELDTFKNCGFLIKTKYKNIESQKKVYCLKGNEVMCKVNQQFHIGLINLPLTSTQIDFDLRKIASRNLKGEKYTNLLLLNKYQSLDRQSLINRWRENYHSTDLKTYFAVDEHGQPLGLSISEQGNGPHGIIIGTTGSGKSQLIQSLIIGLCLNYSPTQLQIIYLDFKGGVDASNLQELPHIDNIIINDTLETATRSIKMLRVEITKRQKCLRTNNCRTISQYRKLFLKKQIESMSHVLVICDEFSELKTFAPNLTEEFNSIARVGRSLGIHLLIASQSISSGISDQIINNCNYRICMRVNSSSESKLMINSDGATRFKKPGQFIFYDHTRQKSYFGTSVQVNFPIYPQRIDIYNQHLEIINLYKQSTVDLKTILLNCLSQQIYCLAPQVICADLPDQLRFYQVYCNSDFANMGLYDCPKSQSLIKLKIPWLELKSILEYITLNSLSSFIDLLLFQMLSVFSSEELIVFIIDLDSNYFEKVAVCNQVSEYITEITDPRIYLIIDFIKKNKGSNQKILLLVSNLDQISVNSQLYECIVNQHLYSLIVFATLKSAKIHNKLITNFPLRIYNYDDEMFQTFLPKHQKLNLLTERCIVQTKDKIVIAQRYYHQISVEDIKTINRTHPRINECFQKMPKLVTRPALKSKDKIFLGVDYVYHTNIYISCNSLVIKGEENSGKSNLLQVIIEQLVCYYKVCIIDDNLDSIAIENENIRYYQHGKINLNCQIIIINKDDFLQGKNSKECEYLLDEFVNFWKRGGILIFEIDKDYIFERKHAINRVIRKCNYQIEVGRKYFTEFSGISYPYCLGDFVITTQTDKWVVRPPMVDKKGII